MTFECFLSQLTHRNVSHEEANNQRKDRLLGHQPAKDSYAIGYTDSCGRSKPARGHPETVCGVTLMI